MALLQVRDFSDTLYALLTVLAEKEKRSIAQQTSYMLESALVGKKENLVSKRVRAIDTLSKMNLTLPKNAPSATELVKHDRNGTLGKEGRLR